MKVTIFFCYAREDELFLNKIKAQLKPLQWQGFIDTWHDQDISAGAEWEVEVNKHLNTSQIILLLISPDFMNSDYCYGTGMKRALERHERGEACVIPIILRPVYWQGTLGKLHALPKNALPVTDPEWHNIDKALFNVAEGIRAVVEKLSKEALAVSSLSSDPLFVTKTLPVNLPKPIPLPPFDPVDPVVSSLPDSVEKVLVVAAKVALLEYIKYSAYICQPKRAFRQSCSRIAFYTNNKIDRRVPKILGQVEAISSKEIEARDDLTDAEKERLLNLLENLDATRSEEWSEQQLKVIFLSSPESVDTLCLANDIVNDLTSENGRGVAFTQGQRYVSLSRLEKGPGTTSELVSDTPMDTG